MVLDAAKGMNYLHSSDPPVIHRDLKSPNLLVDKHWTIKICDFNLSRAIEESGGNVMSSLAATNPRWLAPEILSGKGYTFSSDVYSFGMILWEVLTWTVPWNDISHWQVVHMVTEQKARPEIPNEEGLPGGSFSGFAEYVELMQLCWDQNAEERPKFPHIIEVLRRLMATEAGHGRQDGRSSSLGTDGLLSTGQFTHNGTSLGPSQGASLSPSHNGTSLGLSNGGSQISPQTVSKASNSAEDQERK
jgi:serine/threonine protein kinase